MKKALCVAALLCVSLTGCMFNKADTYTNYVQAALDCSYYGITDEYMDLTGASYDEALAVYDDEVEYVTWMLLEYNDVVEEYINDGLYTGYTALAKTLLNKTSYTVEPAVKSGSVYHVTVVTDPIDFWDITYDPIVELYEDEFADRFADADSDALYEALEAEWGMRVLDVLNEYVDDVGYGEPQTTIVEITEYDDGSYGISDKNWMDIDDLLLGVDSNT